MKYLIVFFLIFACAKEEPVRQTPVKRRPPQNANILNKINSQNAEESLQKIRILEFEEANNRSLMEGRGQGGNFQNTRQRTAFQEPKKETVEEAYLREKQLLDEKYGRNQEVRPLSQPKQQEVKPEASDFPKNNLPPQKSGGNDILEITGNQNIKQQSIIAPPKMLESRFVISTSPSYIGSELEIAKEKLRQFGNLKIVKEGDFFAIKIIPYKELNTEEDAKQFVEEIIKTSFFDIFLEKR